MVLTYSIEQYLRDCFVRGLSTNTISDYYVKLDKFRSFVGDVKCDLITLDKCNEYVAWLRSHLRSSVSVQSYVRSLKAFLSWLFSFDILTVDISSKLKLPKARSDVISVLTGEEINRLFSSLDSSDKLLSLRNKVIVSLMLDSGLRLDEIVTLNKSNVFLDDRYIIVYGKGSKSRYVSFGNISFGFLLSYMTQVVPFLPFDNLLFSYAEDNSYKPMTRDTIKNLFRKLKDKANIPRLYPHLLRHTFATRYLENGGDIFSLQALLGHSSLDMVKKYLHLSKSRIIRDFSRFSPLDFR